MSLRPPFSPLREFFCLTARFCLLLFSIEPVDIWNCEILLTASLDCTVRLWTMEGHFVGELFSWTRFLSVNSVNFQRFRAVGPAFILWSARHAEACPILPQFYQDFPHDPLVFDGPLGALNPSTRRVVKCQQNLLHTSDFVLAQTYFFGGVFYKFSFLLQAFLSRQVLQFLLLLENEYFQMIIWSETHEHLSKNKNVLLRLRCDHWKKKEPC